MAFRLLIASILCVFSLTQATFLDSKLDSSKIFYYDSPAPFQASDSPAPFQARILTPPDDLQEEKEGMKESFLDAYTDFPAELLFGPEKTKELGGTEVAKENALEGAFYEEIEALGKTGIIHIRLETPAEKKLIGFLSVEDWDSYGESPKGFPSCSIYVRQFYILPSFQRRGIGKKSMSTLLKDLCPHTQHIYIATRRINQRAKALYEGLGFKEMVAPLHGLPSEKYISYELHLSS